MAAAEAETTAEAATVEELAAAAEMAAEAMASEVTGAEGGSPGEPLLRILGGSFVQSVDLDASGEVTSLSYRDAASGEVRNLDDLSGCVLALGAKGMKSVMRGSPKLALRAPELTKAASLDAIDVVAVRLWLDTTVPTRTPANVFSKYPSLRGAGGTFFMLDQLQGSTDYTSGAAPDPAELWAGEEPQGSVVACDFYNAGALLPLSDEDIVSLLMDELLPSAVGEFRSAKVVDSYVQRYPAAVTWFSPGSFKKRPPLVTSVGNLVCAGDWVRMGEREHGAKGLCQERAYVSGLEAANSLARRGYLGANSRSHPVIPVREDEPQVVASRALNKLVGDTVKKSPLNPFGLTISPWVR